MNDHMYDVNACRRLAYLVVKLLGVGVKKRRKNTTDECLASACLLTNKCYLFKYLLFAK